MDARCLARFAYASFALALAASPAIAGGVRNVDQPALGVFFEIGEAVAAAADGDTLLVGGGDYTGFTLDGKGLSIFGAPGQVVRVEGTVEVENLATSQRVVLSGLEIHGAAVYPTSKPALVLTGSAGDVRVQRCTLSGGDGEPGGFIDGHGGDAAIVTGCSRVAFTHCLLRGGPGFGAPLGGHDTFGGNGGTALQATGSTIALELCSLDGGAGGEQFTIGGDAGHGSRLAASTVFASSCTFTGADGGDVHDLFFTASGGDGGSGIRFADAASHAELIGVGLAGGAGGTADYGPQNNGAAGQPLSGPGTSHVVPGPARTLSADRDVVADDAALTLTVEGASGDAVHVVIADRPGFRFLPGFVGPWLVRAPVLAPVLPHGTIPPSGVLVLTVPVPDLEAAQDARIDYVQAFCVSTNDGTFSTGSVAIGVLDPAAPPDCDANGSSDYLDTLLGVVPDCDHNLRPDACDPDCDSDGVVDGCELLLGTEADCDRNHVPDACELATGAGSDCNANGILDACEIATGSSQDLNANGLPDECDFNSTWYVDASAPPGGTGSMASPFTSLGEAFVKAISGDTIRVEDGVYTGPANRNLDFLSRELVVQSVHGPASCILEAQLQGRLFVLAGPQTTASRIEGLTIRHGKAPTGTSHYGGAITTQSPTGIAPGVTIRNCVFEDCVAGNGGAVRLGYGGRIEDCVFRRNGIGTAFGGGAINVTGQAPVAIVRSVFEGNEAQRGGAVEVIGTGDVEISHCVFAGNIAHDKGGALSSNKFTGSTDVDDCLFTGNVADHFGGAINVDAGGNNYVSRVKITQTTITNNAAGTDGGGVRGGNGSNVSIDNCIVWRNAAPAGNELSLVSTSGPSSTLAVAWSDVRGALAGVHHPTFGQVVWGSGNLDLDPSFVDADGPDDDPATLGDNDARLSIASPCLDAANNASIPRDANDVDGDGNVLESTPLDLDLLPRRVDVPSAPDTGSGLAPIVDMGAYERR